MKDEWNMHDGQTILSNLKTKEQTEESAEEKKKNKSQAQEVVVDETNSSIQVEPVNDSESNLSKNEQDQLIKGYQEQIRRTQADFENYKRRTEERMASFVEEANCQLICELLPVLDNLDRAALAAPEHKDTASLQEGVIMIHRQFKDVLERAGVNRIPTKGEAFEPERYEAVLYEESAVVSPLHILEELRAGYIFKSKVLRPAMVKVAKEPN